MNETNGMSLLSGVLCFQKEDGSYEKLMELTDIQELKETAIKPDDSMQNNKILTNFSDGCTFTFTFPRYVQKFWHNYINYGWRIRTFVRKKQLMKANKTFKRGYLWLFQNIVNV